MEHPRHYIFSVPIQCIAGTDSERHTSDGSRITFAILWFCLLSNFDDSQLSLQICFSAVTADSFRKAVWELLAKVGEVN